MRTQIQLQANGLLLASLVLKSFCYGCQGEVRVKGKDKVIQVYTPIAFNRKQTLMTNLAILGRSTETHQLMVCQQ